MCVSNARRRPPEADRCRAERTRHQLSGADHQATFHNIPRDACANLPVHTAVDLFLQRDAAGLGGSLQFLGAARSLCPPPRADPAEHENKHDNQHNEKCQTDGHFAAMSRQCARRAVPGASFGKKSLNCDKGGGGNFVRRRLGCVWPVCVMVVRARNRLARRGLENRRLGQTGTPLRRRSVRSHREKWYLIAEKGPLIFYKIHQKINEATSAGVALAGGAAAGAGATAADTAVPALFICVSRLLITSTGKLEVIWSR
jgi:hypothetical protein